MRTKSKKTISVRDYLGETLFRVRQDHTSRPYPEYDGTGITGSRIMRVHHAGHDYQVVIYHSQFMDEKGRMLGIQAEVVE